MILQLLYRLKNRGGREIPYYYRRSILTQLWHSLRKFICQNIAPNCILNFTRVNLYRLCGFKIGKNVFIGMKCYFDDLCVDNIVIEDECGVSYGVYFACHGVYGQGGQSHNKIVLRKGSHIGMHSSIMARQDIEIGEGVIIGAMSFVNQSIPAGKVAVGIPCRVIHDR